MIRLMLLLLTLTVSTFAADEVLIQSIWCDGLDQLVGRTHMVTMKFHYNRSRSECAITEGQSTEYQSLYEQKFSCKVSRIENREDSLLLIQLDSLEATGSGDLSRATQMASFFYDLVNRRGHGIERLKGDTLIPLRCVNGL